MNNAIILTLFLQKKIFLTKGPNKCNQEVGSDPRNSMTMEKILKNLLQ
jgi:hypothetical protein